jgi:hypothetical protein
MLHSLPNIVDSYSIISIYILLNNQFIGLFQLKQLSVIRETPPAALPLISYLLSQVPFLLSSVKHLIIASYIVRHMPEFFIKLSHRKSLSQKEFDLLSRETGSKRTL